RVDTSRHSDHDPREPVCSCRTHREYGSIRRLEPLIAEVWIRIALDTEFVVAGDDPLIVDDRTDRPHARLAVDRCVDVVDALLLIAGTQTDDDGFRRTTNRERDSVDDRVCPDGLEGKASGDVVRESFEFTLARERYVVNQGLGKAIDDGRP